MTATDASADTAAETPARDPTGPVAGPARDALGRRLPLLSVLIALAVGSVYVAQPLFFLLADRFATTPEAMRDLFAATVTIYALSFFVAGPLTDLWPATSLMAGGAVVLGLCLAVAAMAAGSTVFAVAAVAGSVAAAFVPAAGFALLARRGPPDLQGVYFGIAIAASIVGITLCRSVSAIVVAQIGYAPFMVAFAGVLGLSALALLRGGGDAPPGAAQGAVLGKYRAALALLVEAAILRRLAVGGLLFFGYLGLATYLTFRLAAPPFSLETAQIGMVNVVGLIAVIGAPGSGMAIRRWGSRAVGAAGLACAIAGAVIVWQAEALAAVALGLVLLFLGTFATQPVKLVELSAIAGPARRGAASSLYLLVCLLLGGFSATALAPIWSAWGWDGTAAAALAALVLALALHLWGGGRDR